MTNVPIWVQITICVLAAIGATGVADVLLFTGRIGVLFGRKWNALIGRK